MFDGGEKATPLLLADTLTFVVPSGQVSVVPGEVPQPPVHLSIVSGHWLGSEKPSCDSDTLAPLDDVPGTVTVPLPVRTGSAAWIEESAFARPDPKVFGSPRPSAFCTSSLRSVVRAVTGSAAPVAPATRHGADCSASAAMPAT